MPKKTRDLTNEEHAALKAFADAYGRTWKSAVRATWMAASTPGIIQSLRNDPAFGPTGLAKYKLPKRKLETEPEPKLSMRSIYYCPDCGGTRIQWLEWVEMNTYEIVGDEVHDQSYYCPDCNGGEGGNPGHHLTREEPFFGAELEALIAKAEEKSLKNNDIQLELDEVIHDAQSEIANDTNNEDIEAQCRALINEHKWTKEQVFEKLTEIMTSDEDDPVAKEGDEVPCVWCEGPVVIGKDDTVDGPQGRLGHVECAP